MAEQLIVPASIGGQETPADEPSPQDAPETSGRIVIRDPPPAPNVLPGLAMGSLVAAILLSLLIAISQGETTPLYITWIAALVMAAVFGVIAAVPRVRRRSRTLGGRIMSGRRSH